MKKTNIHRIALGVMFILWLIAFTINRTGVSAIIFGFLVTLVFGVGFFIEKEDRRNAKAKSI